MQSIVSESLASASPQSINHEVWQVVLSKAKDLGEGMEVFKGMWLKGYEVFKRKV